jgi:hypothetical protein
MTWQRYKYLYFLFPQILASFNDKNATHKSYRKIVSDFDYSKYLKDEKAKSNIKNA